MESIFIGRVQNLTWDRSNNLYGTGPIIYMGQVLFNFLGFGISEILGDTEKSHFYS